MIELSGQRARAAACHELTPRTGAGNVAGKESKGSERSGIRARQIRGFCLPGFLRYAGRATDTRPRTGKEVRRLRSAFNLPAYQRARVKALPLGFSISRRSRLMSQLPAVVSFQSVSLPVVCRDGLPHLTARDLAHALGYADTSAVTRIYAAHRNEFTNAMSLTVKTTARGQAAPTAVRIFSARGCHLIGMFARTPVAAEFRRWVLDVLEGYGQPQPTTALSPDEHTFIERFRALKGNARKVLSAIIILLSSEDVTNWKLAMQVIGKFVPGIALPDAATSQNAPNFRAHRWMLSWDADGAERMTAIPDDAFVLTIPGLLRALAAPGEVMLDTETLTAVTTALVSQLAARASQCPKDVLPAGAVS